MYNIDGKFKFLIFNNETSGYIVAKFKSNQHNELITVTGYVYNIDFTCEYELEGEDIIHHRYGNQFQIHTARRKEIDSKEMMIQFLSSELFTGIGLKTATKLVDLFGKETLVILKENPEKIIEYGFSSKIVDSLTKGLSLNNDLNDDLVIMRQSGINDAILKKAKLLFGDEYIKKMKDDIFYASRHINGLSYRIAYDYATRAKVERVSLSSQAAKLLENIKNDLFVNGDTYLNVSKFYGVDELLAILIDEQLIVIEDDRLYLKDIYDSELSIAHFIAYFLDSEEISFDLETAITSQEQQQNIIFDEQQKKAIEMFFKNRLMVITGGPGTGKTTITKALINIYKSQFPQKTISLCAPTGRASKLLNEITGNEATTIHRLLKWDAENDLFTVNIENPLNTSLLVIDEFSMVDLKLAASVFEAARYVDKILLIGDKDQLPSIAVGNVLNDMLNIEFIKRIVLNVNHRQKQLSGIIQLANDINNANLITEYSNVEFYAIDNYSSKEVHKEMLSQILEKVKDETYEYQVLSAMYRGDFGIDALNSFLQNQLNPASANKKEIKIGSKLFREQDKILQLKNQVEENVYNGDIGIISEIDEISKIITVEFDQNEVSYSGETLSNITLGYCISIHKAQGSEYPFVMMFLPKEHSYMQNKNLIYTGVTRAKNQLTLFVDKDHLHYSIAKKLRPRQTTLTKKIITVYNNIRNEIIE